MATVKLPLVYDIPYLSRCTFPLLQVQFRSFRAATLASDDRDKPGPTSPAPADVSDKPGKASTYHEALVQRARQLSRHRQDVFSGTRLQREMPASGRGDHRLKLSRFQQAKGSDAAAEETKRKPAAWVQAYSDPSTGEYVHDYTPLGSIGGRVYSGQQQPPPSRVAQPNAPSIYERIAEINAGSVRAINANQEYAVGQRYSPAELNPYARESSDQKQQKAKNKDLYAAGMAAEEQDNMPFCNVQVRREVSFKNVGMLMAFTGRQGMMLGRRGKHVRAVTQRKVSRAIKNARQMALLPFVGLHPALEDEDAESMRDVFESLQATAISQGM